MLKNPLIVALDLDSDSEALNLASKLSTKVGAFKLGPRLVMRYGSSFAEKIASYAPLFIDCKFYDIPNTMISSVRSSFDMGASLVTIHALSGLKAMCELAELEKELNKIRPFKILAVTVLTSFDDKSLPDSLRPESCQKHVERMSKEVFKSGLTGFVCSPFEIDQINSISNNAFIVTPGIRLVENDKGDQSRVAGPAEAIKRGASAIVVGRPIVESNDIENQTHRFLSELEIVR